MGERVYAIVSAVASGLGVWLVVLLAKDAWQTWQRLGDKVTVGGAQTPPGHLHVSVYLTGVTATYAAGPDSAATEAGSPLDTLRIVMVSSSP